VKIEYVYFSSGKDYSVILGERVKDFRITMERLGDVEILARSDYGIIGKVDGIEFIAAVDAELISGLHEDETLKKTVVVFDETAVSEAYEEFTLGKIKFSKDTIQVSCKFDEDFFYSAFPLFDIHLARAFLLVSNNETVAKELINKEKVVARRVTELSFHVKSCDSIPDLESVVSELSSIQVDLFTKLVRFRDHNEEILESLNKAEYVARPSPRVPRSVRSARTRHPHALRRWRDQPNPGWRSPSRDLRRIPLRTSSVLEPFRDQNDHPGTGARLSESDQAHLRARM